jgi:catechol 2,3-dioxygenase-like lactoylglutathione lyase family enzyme
MAKLIGLRHLALNVRDVGRSTRFYTEVLEMRVVWEPDPLNIYLTSGSDNLALHGLLEGREIAGEQSLHHLGFLVGSAEDVLAWADELERKGVPVTASPRRHRDGSFSLYFNDPDGNLIQILYEPNAIAGRPHEHERT